jgi:hypothetical protein
MCSAIQGVYDEHYSKSGLEYVLIDEIESVQNVVTSHTEYQQVTCINTSGQTFAIWLNVVYLTPLTFLFVRFFIKSYLRRGELLAARQKALNGKVPNGNGHAANGKTHWSGADRWMNDEHLLKQNARYNHVSLIQLGSHWFYALRKSFLSTNNILSIHITLSLRSSREIDILSSFSEYIWLIGTNAS